MKDVYLISCTKSKQNRTCKAEEMYMPSTKFRASLAYAENRVNSRTEQIFILSAKYGLLELDEIIETYDETLFGKPQAECDGWGSQVVKGLSSRFNLAETNFVILAGSSYVNPLVGKLEHITTPLKGMPMAESISWLQRHQKPSREREVVKSQITTARIPDWDELHVLLKDGADVQTINWKGEPNLWFHAKSDGHSIHVGPAKKNIPSSKASPRHISRMEYIKLMPYYYPWREKQVDRAEAASISMNSSYVFALMNHYSRRTADIVKTPRMLVDAKYLREMDYLKAISGDMPGWYRWWAPEEALRLMLDSPYLEDKFFDFLSPHLTKGKGLLADYYCLYVGVAIKESIQSRLDWHVNQKHTIGNVRNGTLSTLRQTISSLLKANQFAQDETNDFIDMLKIEFQASPFPLKSDEAKHNIESVENMELKKTIYPLNIKDNEHDDIQQFRKQLSRLRYYAKEQALK